MAFGYENGNVIVWDITTGENFTLFASQIIVKHIEFSADDSLIATGTDQSAYYIWAAVNHSMKAKIEYFSYSFSFSPTGQACFFRASRIMNNGRMGDDFIRLISSSTNLRSFCSKLRCGCAHTWNTSKTLEILSSRMISKSCCLFLK